MAWLRQAARTRDADLPKVLKHPLAFLRRFGDLPYLTDMSDFRHHDNAPIENARATHRTVKGWRLMWAAAAALQDPALIDHPCNNGHREALITVLNELKEEGIT